MPTAPYITCLNHPFPSSLGLGASPYEYVSRHHLDTVSMDLQQNPVSTTFLYYQSLLTRTFNVMYMKFQDDVQDEVKPYQVGLVSLMYHG